VSKHRLEEFGGDLAPALDGTLAAAKKALRRFPESGSRRREDPPLLRPPSVPRARLKRPARAPRLGFAREEKSYAKSYAAARASAASLPARIPVLQ
jgi:hypothetical protein